MQVDTSPGTSFGVDFLRSMPYRANKTNMEAVEISRRSPFPQTRCSAFVSSTASFLLIVEKIWLEIRPRERVVYYLARYYIRYIPNLYWSPLDNDLGWIFQGSGTFSGLGALPILGSRHVHRPSPTPIPNPNPNPDPQPDPKRARNGPGTWMRRVRVFLLEYCELRNTSFLPTLVETYNFPEIYNLPLEDPS